MAVGPNDDEEGAGAGERERLRATSRYSLWVGVAFLIVVIVAGLNAFRSNEGGLLGADDAEAGTPLAEFALSALPDGPDNDANVFQDDCGSSEKPCPADEQRTAACEVEGEGVIRVCDFFDRPLVISFWFTSPADCPPTQDVVDRVAGEYEDEVGFLSIAVRGDRAEIEGIIEERGWTLPVGWDRDGAISNLYRVGVCPTVAFVLPGGILSTAQIGSDDLTADGLRGAIEELITESGQRRRATR